MRLLEPLSWRTGMTDVTNALEAVAALIGERTKYEGWITSLATKSDVPSHVLEKVRGDYTSRLRTVLNAFTSHQPALESALAQLRSRDGALGAQETACRDEFAEGELRHMVGEYDGEQWEKVRVGHEALLVRIGSERESLSAEISRVQRSLEAASDAATRGRALGEAPVGVTATPVAVVADAPDAKAVAAPQPTAAAPAAVRSTPPAVAAAASAPSDDRGFLRGAATSSAGGVGVMASAVATATKTPDAAPALRIVPSSPTSVPTVASATPTAPVDAAKTLRCAECGTMNYPTEWYCERCGGELAVL